jgi:aryl-alcohol dehydrogenase-like predicted oxidoreductase
MKYRSAGNSNFTLSEIGLGCWAFGGGDDDYWGAREQKDTDAIVHRAVDLGLTYFDTAEVYNDGRSERSLGIAIQGIPRDRIIIGSKVSPDSAYADKIVAHCEASLKRLNTDYLDLYMIHWALHSEAIKFFTKDQTVIDNPPTVPEAFAALEKLKQQGKIRNIGVSNFGVARTTEVLDTGVTLAANQLACSLLTRAVEFEIAPFCQQQNIAIIGYSTLMQGILADAFQTLEDIPLLRKRTRHFDSRTNELSRHGETGAEPEMKRTLTDIRQIVQDSGIPMSDLAIKWAVANPHITCALVGASSLKQLEKNVQAVERDVSPEIIDKLTDISDDLKTKLGPSLDIYQGVAEDRTK